MTSTPGPSAAEAPAAVPFAPVPVVDLELTDPVASPEPNGLGQLWVLVRLHGTPLGVMSWIVEPLRQEQHVHQDAVDRFRDQIGAHLAGDGLPVDDLEAGLRAAAEQPCAGRAPVTGQRASVVVCTLGQDPRLVHTVESVLSQSHSALELIVVDNDPASGRVREALAAVQDPRVTVVSEPRRGLSVARNTGLAAASTSFIAYTDDDAYVDPDWLASLLAPFAEHRDVVCVTGLVLPAALDTPAQLWFEEFGAFDKGFSRTVWSARDRPELVSLGPVGEAGVLFPYSAGVFGSGNNMAFRTGWLTENGGFDVALGAGTLSRGGEDLDAFLDVMLAGQVLVYEPRALVRHHARDDMAGLRQQMYGYGSGMSAVIAKHFFSSPAGALAILGRLPAGLRKLLDPTSTKNESKSTEFPKELGRLELRGYAAGPALYFRGRRNAAQRSKRAVST